MSDSDKGTPQIGRESYITNKNTKFMEKQSQRLNVIIIDDDHTTVEVFSDYLELNNINVIGKGYDGNDAVNLYSKLKPDIIFLDVMMPKFDGFYGLKKIKEINPHAIVIMVTADLQRETQLKLEGLNANAIIYKPFEIEQLMETIDKLALKCEVSK